MYSNAGEGTDSTGLYTNGASPTTPALDMTSSGVNSAQWRRLQRSYDLRRYNVDDDDHGCHNSSQNFTTSWTINIPGTVGSNTAYVGFTGGTGGLTAIQEILDWTYATSIDGRHADVQSSAGNIQLGSIGDAVGHDGGRCDSLHDGWQHAYGEFASVHVIEGEHDDHDSRRSRWRTDTTTAPWQAEPTPSTRPRAPCQLQPRL